jgi:predicted ATPase
MAKLDRIEIQGFKSIRALDLRLEPLNLLIGANGSGKSNFIAAFGLLSKIVERQLQVQVARSGGADSLLHYGSRNTRELFFRLRMGANGYEARLAPDERDRLFFTEEHLWIQRDGKPEDTSWGSGHRETELFNVLFDPQAVAGSIDILRGRRVYHFHDTSSEAAVQKTGDLHDNDFLRSDAANLAAFLYYLRERHEAYYRQIVATIQLAAPFFGDFALRPDPLNEEKIRLEWSERGSDAYFGANALSDGSLRFICLATLLLQPEPPSTILIDEPELGLHPYAISLLAGLLKSAATRTQVIVSTQSVTLVNQFTPEDIVVVEREDRESVFRRLSSADLENWLEDYGLGDLWEENVLGDRPHWTGPR